MLTYYNRQTNWLVFKVMSLKVKVTEVFAGGCINRSTVRRRRPSCSCWVPVASLRWCHPFYLKKWWPFSVIVLKSEDLFYSLSPLFPSPPFQVIVCPFFGEFSRKKIFRLLLGCHPLDGVIRGGPPSDATVEYMLSRDGEFRRLLDYDNQ